MSGVIKEYDEIKCSPSDIKQKVIKKYKILREELGRGSYARVYKGVCRDDNIAVAIKIISLFRMKPELKTRMKLEADYIRKSAHENVIKLYDVYSDEKYLVLVLEYCQGRDLDKFIKENGPMDEVTSQKFMSQLLLCVDFLHAEGIVHRDLKPHNLLLTSENIDQAEIRVTDFGLARYFSEKNCLSKTICGSPFYMAPETLNEEVYNVQKVDIWSLGVILYQMLTGKMPFNGKNIKTLRENVNLKADVFVDLENVVSPSCLAFLKKLLNSPSIHLII